MLHTYQYDVQKHAAPFIISKQFGQIKNISIKKNILFIGFLQENVLAIHTFLKKNIALNCVKVRFCSIIQIYIDKMINQKLFKECKITCLV